MPTSIYTDETIYKPELWAREGLQILFENIGLRGMVHTDFNEELAEKGDTVNTRVPAIFTAQATGANGQVTATQNPQATKIPIVLDTNIEVTYPIRDVNNSNALADLRNEFFEPAILAILRKIEDDGLAALVHATNGFGDATDSHVINATAGSPFAPATFKLVHIATAAYHLDDAKVPDDNMRMMVISHKQLLDLITTGAGVSGDLLLKANEAAGQSALRERFIGRLMGFNIAMQQGVPSEAAAATGFPNAGVDVAPFFHRNAVAYVNRPLPGVPPQSGAAVSVQSFANQSIRVSIGYSIMDKHTLMSTDVLYGWKVMRQEMGGVIKTANTVST